MVLFSFIFLCPAVGSVGQETLLQHCHPNTEIRVQLGTELVCYSILQLKVTNRRVEAHTSLDMTHWCSHLVWCSSCCCCDFAGLLMHCVKDEHTAINMNLHYLENGCVMVNFIFRKELFFLPLGFALKVSSEWLCFPYWINTEVLQSIFILSNEKKLIPLGVFSVNLPILLGGRSSKLCITNQTLSLQQRKWLQGQEMRGESHSHGFVGFF